MLQWISELHCVTPLQYLQSTVVPGHERTVPEQEVPLWYHNREGHFHVDCSSDYEIRTM